MVLVSRTCRRCRGCGVRRRRCAGRTRLPPSAPRLASRGRATLEKRRLAATPTCRDGVLRRSSPCAADTRNGRGATRIDPGVRACRQAPRTISPLSAARRPPPHAAPVFVGTALPAHRIGDASSGAAGIRARSGSSRRGLRMPPLRRLNVLALRPRDEPLCGSPWPSALLAEEHREDRERSNGQELGLAISAASAPELGRGHDIEPRDARVVVLRLLLVELPPAGQRVAEPGGSQRYAVAAGW